MLFIKPNSYTKLLIGCIKDTIRKEGLRVESHGKLRSSDIISRKIFDRQYSDLLKNAELTKPSDVKMSESEQKLFQSSFNLPWMLPFGRNQTLNAKDACLHLQIEPSELILVINMGHTIKVRKGLYCTRIDSSCLLDEEKKGLLSEPIFVLNGFYYYLKSMYNSPDTVIGYMLLEWNRSKMDWNHFMKEIIGDPDPSIALPSSIRGQIYANWEHFQLPAIPTAINNAIHVSSSAFEGLVDRLVWVKGSILYTDPFGSRMLSAGVPATTLQSWVYNPYLNNNFILSHMNGKGGDDCITTGIELRSKFLNPIPCINYCTIMACTAILSCISYIMHSFLYRFYLGKQKK